MHDIEKTQPDLDKTMPLFSTPEPETTHFDTNATDSDETPQLHRPAQDKLVVHSGGGGGGGGGGGQPPY